MNILIKVMVGVFLSTITVTFAAPIKKEKFLPVVKPIASKGKNVEWLSASKNLRGKMLLGVGNTTRRRWKIIKWDDQGRLPKSIQVSNVNSGFGSGLPLWSPVGNRFRVTAFGTRNDYSTTIGIFKSSGQRETSFGPEVYATWGAFSPLGTRFARAEGSTFVVGSGRVGDDYSLRIWNGTSEIQLPVGPSFLAGDKDEAMVSWRGENELLVTQETSQQIYRSKPQLRIDSVNSDGKTKLSIWLQDAWKPLVSPDKKWVAFYGPENAAQKPTQGWADSPMGQPLCVARYDKRTLREQAPRYSERRPLGYFDATYPSVFWTPSSQFLITAQDKSGDKPFVRIQRFRVSDGRREVLADLYYSRSGQKKPKDVDSVSWKFGGISRDEKYLYLTFIQSAADNRYVHETHQWFRFGLSSRKLEKLAFFRDCEYSWYDESQN